MKLKTILIIPMALIEVLALLIGWALAFAYKPWARKWADFYMRILPDGKWYYSE